MPTDTVTIDRAVFDRLRQCAGLADVLLDQLETAQALAGEVRDYSASPEWDAVNLVLEHARQVLRPESAIATKTGSK